MKKPTNITTLLSKSQFEGAIRTVMLCSVCGPEARKPNAKTIDLCLKCQRQILCAPGEEE